MSSQHPPVDGTQWACVHLLLMHWSSVLQPVPSSNAQVLVCRLQLPLRHTALASMHVPPCSPSFGMPVPACSLGLQVKLLRLQYWLGSVQSASTKQPSVDGTQCPLVQVL